MTEQPKVAVVILNWNGFDDSVECLRSLSRSTYRNYGIILVDNGSGNKEGTRLKEMFPDICLVENRVNRGFAGGNNDGITVALTGGYEYIIMLNNDCVVEADWLSKFILGIKMAGADFGTCRMMFYSDRELICSDSDIIFPDGSAVCENRYKKYDKNKHARDIVSACGAGAIFSRASLHEVKIRENECLDELYFAFYEDVDLSIRLNMKGYKGVSIPDAVVYHKHSASAGKYSKLKVFHSEKNRILNEILNFPIYFFLIGEIYFVLKLLFLFTYQFFAKDSKGGKYVRGIGLVDTAICLIKARWWVLSHISLIANDRNERKNKGFIKWSVLNLFCWDMRKVLI